MVGNNILNRNCSGNEVGMMAPGTDDEVIYFLCELSYIIKINKTLK